MQNMWSLRSILFSILLGLSAVSCGGSGSSSNDTVVIVDVAGVAPTVQLLRVTTTLNGIAAIGSEDFAGNVTRFGLEFPMPASGALSINVDALDAMGCLIASGVLSTQVNGENQVEVMVTLMNLPARECNGQVQPTVAVTLSGNGTGSVTSTPAGISCGQQCSAEFSAGAQVVLTAAADPNMSFSGWSGACTSTNPACTVTVNGLVSVTANFTNNSLPPPPGQKACTDPHWCWDTPLPQGNTLRHVFGTATNNYWAVGDVGMILHFDGTQWTQVASGTVNRLWGVWGRSATDVFAVGINGTILHYDGKQWSPQSSGVGNDLTAVWGNTAEVWAVGSGGVLLHYDGMTWTIKASNVGNVTLRAIWGSSPNDVMAVGDQGTATHFNGTAWSPTSGLLNGQSYRGVWGTSSTNIWTVGSSGSIYTWDGSGWTVFSSGSTANFYDIWGTSANNIWITGDGSTTLFWNGSTLSSVPNPGALGYYGVFGTANNDVYVVGTSGMIRHFNGTVPWSDVSTAARPDQFAIWGSSPMNLWTVGNGTNLHYDGTAWTVANLQTTTPLYGVYGSSAQDVWAVGSTGTIQHYDGMNWTASTSNITQTIYGVYAAAPDKAFAAANNYLLAWDGTRWTPTFYNGNSFYGIWGTSANDVWTVGANSASQALIWHYANGSWSNSALPMNYFGVLFAVSGSDSTDVWASGSGGYMFRWDGSKWSSAISPAAGINFTGIWASGPNQAWVTANTGQVYTWDGLSWTPSTVMAVGLTGVFGFDATHAWVSGQGGAVLRYTP